MIARLWQWLESLLDPHRDHSPALGALMREHEELLNGQRRAMGGPTAEQLGRPVVDMLTGLTRPCHSAPEPSFGVSQGEVKAALGEMQRRFQPDAFVFDGPAMAQRLTITLPLDLATWIDAERGTATREEFALGRLYIAKIVGDLQHSDIRSMQEAMRTHSVAAALRNVKPGDTLNVEIRGKDFANGY